MVGTTKMLELDKVNILPSAFTHVTLALKETAARSNKVMLYESGFKKAAGEADFRSLLLRVKSLAPDALAFCASRDTALLARQLNELRMTDLPNIQFVVRNSPEGDTPKLRKTL